MTVLPPLNTPIKHTGGATCPVHPETMITTNLDKTPVSAGSAWWKLVTTYTIIARAPADRIKELEAALENIVYMGHDCPATFEGDDAAWEARRAYLMQSLARAALKGATE